MIFPSTHTVNFIRTKSAIVLHRMLVVVLFSLMFVGAYALLTTGQCDQHLSIDSAIQSHVKSSPTAFGKVYLPLHSLPGLPRSGSHEESMIEPESVQDDDVSEDLPSIAETRPDHRLEEGRLLLLSASLAIRPTISLIILHHSWKMYLS